MRDTLNSHNPTSRSDIPGYPMTRDARCPFAPPPQSLEFVSGEPVSRVRIWNGSTPWLVTGYKEAHALFSDPRVSVDDRLPGFPHWNEAFAATAHERPRSVFTSDAEEHTKFRRMLSKPFTFKRVESLRPAIQTITDECIDAMLSGSQPADIVTALALPIPSLVISRLLGVPYEDAGFFQEQADIKLDRFASAEENAKRSLELAGYLAALVEEKMAEPAEDAVSDLADRVKAGEVTVKEAAQLASGLLVAGHETTANMIGLGVLALLEHPDQLALLRDSIDQAVIANAVEELLRYLSIVHTGQRRIALEDIEIDSVVIQAGEGIIIDLAPANWDAEMFAEPDRLSLDRTTAAQNMAFGYGRHQCVGQQLARAELQIVFSTLFRRIPTLRLATSVSEVPFKHDRLAYGVYELPVAW